MVRKAYKTSKPYLTEAQLNTIRGKVLVSRATPKEILSVFAHLDQIEDELSERDDQDFFGTEGWRHAFGLPDAD